MQDDALRAASTTRDVDSNPVVDSTSERSGRRSWVVVGASIGLAAIVASGVAGIVNRTGETTEGGAATPEELGDRLIAVAEGTDVLDAIELLEPGERRSLGEPFVALVAELPRLGALTRSDLSETAASRPDGISVELIHETVSATPTNVLDIVNVDIGADAVVSVDGGDPPAGAQVTDEIEPETVVEPRSPTSTDRVDLSLTAVEHEGRWYFSLLHTAAEVARNGAMPERGVPTEGIGAIGAASPEGALDRALDHVEQLDLRSLLRTLDPDAAVALQRYAPLFLDAAEAALAEIPLTWQITGRRIRVEGDGAERTVFVDRLTIDGSAADAEFRLGVADGCTTAAVEGEASEACSSGAADLGGVLADAPEAVALIDTVADVIAGIGPGGVAVRERDGEWFVSPMGSMSELILNLLRALDREETDAIVAAFEPAIDALPEAVADVLDDPGLDVAGAVADEPAARPDAIADFDDEPAWVACYDEPGAAAVTACLDPYLASGEIGPGSVPAVLRFPECGYAEPWWSGEVHGMSDRDFIAAVTPAGECFAELIDHGAVSAVELPNELVHLECFEGRNWYRVIDDPEFDERYDGCIDERTGD